LLKPRNRLPAVAAGMTILGRKETSCSCKPATSLPFDGQVICTMRRDAEFQTVYRRVCTPFVPLGIKLLLSLPDTMLFFSHAAGSPIIATLLQAAMMSPDYPDAAVSYAEVGDRFGVSRTHVRKLLVAAEHAGLVKLHARGGHRMEILPRLWSSYDRGLATGMYVHDMTYMVTMKALGAARAVR
jgi:biotin operon repressor